MVRRAWRMVAVGLLAGASAAQPAAKTRAPAAQPAAPAVQASAPAIETPRLVGVISIDQFRGDYLARFADPWLPAGGGGRQGGGFRDLMGRGGGVPDGRHDPHPLVGMAGGGAAARMGIAPTTLRVSTVGDELKMASGGRAKVWGLALKDRAAVLMAGRLADGALWFDEASGAWISSRWYRPDGTLPGWVARLNGGHRPGRWFGRARGPPGPAAGLAPRRAKGG